MTWPPGVDGIEEVTDSLMSMSIEDQEQKEKTQALKDEMFLKELGFSVIVEEIMEAYKINPTLSIIGHNMMYDIIYFYNQFVGPLPDTFEDFVFAWNLRFPRVYDTKVLSFKADYFGKTILGRIFEKCQDDKRLKDILGFKFDLKNGFQNYHGADLLSHYHEAGYDAYMTGYVYSKIAKYKEIDALH